MAYIFSWRDLPEPGVTFDMNSILEQSTNFRYRAAPIYDAIRKSSQVNGRASSIVYHRYAPQGRPVRASCVAAPYEADQRRWRRHRDDLHLQSSVARSR